MYRSTSSDEQYTGAQEFWSVFQGLAVPSYAGRFCGGKWASAVIELHLYCMQMRDLLTAWLQGVVVLLVLLWVRLPPAGPPSRLLRALRAADH